MLTLEPYFCTTWSRESYEVAVTLLPLPRDVTRPREKLKFPSPTMSVGWDAEYVATFCMRCRSPVSQPTYQRLLECLFNMIVLFAFAAVRGYLSVGTLWSMLCVLQSTRTCPRTHATARTFLDVSPLEAVLCLSLPLFLPFCIRCLAMSRRSNLAFNERLQPKRQLCTTSAALQSGLFHTISCTFVARSSADATSARIHQTPTVPRRCSGRCNGGSLTSASRGLM